MGLGLPSGLLFMSGTFTFLGQWQAGDQVALGWPGSRHELPWSRLMGHTLLLLPLHNPGSASLICKSKK